MDKKYILIIIIIFLFFIYFKNDNVEYKYDVIINVINLDKSKERLHYFKNMCNKFFIKYNKISGIDGSKYKLKKYEKDIFKNVDYDKNKKGVIGCHLSHMKALNILKDNKYSIICEDDIVILEPEFNKTINEILKKININDNYLIYLSGYNNMKPKEKVFTINDKYSLYKGNNWYGQGNMMYLITQKCMKDLLNKNNNKYVRTAIDWHFIYNAVNILIIYPPLVTHRKNHTSDIEYNNKYNNKY